MNWTRTGRREERERRARRELEAYTKVMLSRRRVEDFDRQGSEICETVVTHSRFAQAALLLEARAGTGWPGLRAWTRPRPGRSASWPRGFRRGFSRARLRAARRGAKPDAAPRSHALADARATISKRLRFTSVLAVPMMGRSVTEGALLLTGMRPRRAVPSGGRRPAARRRPAAHRNAGRTAAGHAQPDQDV